MNNCKSSQNKRLIIISLISIFAIFIIISLNQINYLEIPNQLSNYLNQKTNKGTEAEIINSTSNLDILKDLKISDCHSDYGNLPIKDFANFTCLHELGLKENYIYKSSSPNNNSSRSQYVKEHIQANNIKNIIDLENNQDSIKSNNYGTNNVLYAPVNDDFNDDTTKKSIQQIIGFINNNEGSILIICTDGATKSGLICSLLQCLNTSSYDYIKAQYIRSFINLYSPESLNKNYSSQEIETALNIKLRNELSNILSLTNHNIIYLNLNKYTRQYFQNCGISDEDIDKAASKLAK